MNTPTRTVTANAIGLVVSDLTRAIAFYEVLGVHFGQPMGDDHIEADLGSGFRLMLDTESSLAGFHPGWTPPTGSPRCAVAFMVGTPADVDAVHAELLAAGGSTVLAPWDAPWGQRYASVADPDGNAVDLYAALATPEGDA